MVLTGYNFCRKVRNLKDTGGYGIMLEFKDDQLMRTADILLYHK
ncbi:hypothetical protein KIS1582_2850 [Cytobacillus firmus]|uniref:Uncharacterized protein n=1 Tax=Cytobacillus firmus TaxID=1399 RepID=A0A800NA46_CYTFI|nr:hypothetical protein KIS1582_2850 [Cytobacillus firmus]